ncbi:uncharacterized protein [Lepeophtheirus salmonis]|uniref:uncharacterized protein isoform X2 n=1 Tax=Lepeophtheirus salmonis TaxID=72036 RepID=UPI003AF38060
MSEEKRCDPPEFRCNSPIVIGGVGGSGGNKTHEYTRPSSSPRQLRHPTMSIPEDEEVLAGSYNYSRRGSDFRIDEEDEDALEDARALLKAQMRSRRSYSLPFFLAGEKGFVLHNRSGIKPRRHQINPRI